MMNVIDVSQVFTKYDPNDHYRLWATLSSSVVLKLTNIAPMDVPIGNDMDCIDFLSTIPLFSKIATMDNAEELRQLREYEIKDALKVKKITGKRNYHLLTSIKNVVEPKLYELGAPSMSYGAALIGKKKNGELRGYLLLLSPYLVMGIWPITNRKLYENRDISELQGVFRKEINEFTKPKLWSEVWMINHPSKKK